MKQARSDNISVLTNSWIVYFDILGFSSWVQDNPCFVLEQYEAALQASTVSDTVMVDKIHFSDTFLFYSIDNSPQAYSWLQCIAKNFMLRCIYKKIPLRGAIAHGEFYVDKSKGVYFGKALIDAYKEAESQDWVGLIIEKSAEKKITQDYKLNPSHHNFICTKIPRNSKHNGQEEEGLQFFAYDFHGKTNIEGILSNLAAMKNDAPLKQKQKYDNTTSFIKTFSSNYAS